MPTIPQTKSIVAFVISSSFVLAGLANESITYVVQREPTEWNCWTDEPFWDFSTGPRPGGVVEGSRRVGGSHQRGRPLDSGRLGSKSIYCPRWDTKVLPLGSLTFIPDGRQT